LKADYSTLLNKYNRIVAAYNTLSSQIKDKERLWREREQAISVTAAHARALCEEILAKDPNEMVLGRGYSWGGVEIDRLFEKARESFRTYNSNRTDLMRRLADESEERRLTIEGLERQIVSSGALGRMKDEDAAAEGRPDPEDGDGEDTGYPAPEKSTTHMPEKPKPAPENAQTTAVPAPYAIQKAADTGRVEMIIEEDADFTVVDEADADAARNLSETLSRLGARDIPVHPSRKKAKKKQEAAERKQEAYLVNLADYKSKMTGAMWIALDAIGTYGISRYGPLEQKIKELWDASLYKQESIAEGKYAIMNGSRVRFALQGLEQMNVTASEQVSDGLRSKFFVWSLTPMGSMLYKDRHGKEAVLSERDRIVAEHDNLEHGYGIAALAEMLRESGSYKKVSDSPRENKITLEGNVSYIPDITAEVGGEKPFTVYIEYERGRHSQDNFNIKMRKMCRVTRYLNIVAQNKDAEQKSVTRACEWVKSEGRAALKGKKIRISTIASLKDKDAKLDASWYWVWDLRHEEPAINQEIPARPGLAGAGDGAETRQGKEETK
jgi:hypothetical protein